MAARNESPDESLVTPDDTSVRDDASVPDADVPAADRAEDGESAGVRAVTEQARQARPQRRQPASAEVAPKGVPTPKASSRQAVAVSRTTPVQFVNQSVDELKKVVWPTGADVRRYFVAVLVFVVAVIVFVGLLDLLFGWALLRLFG